MLFSKEDNQSKLTKGTTRGLQNFLGLSSSKGGRRASSSTTSTNINFATGQCIKGQQELMGFCFLLFASVQRHFP